MKVNVVESSGLSKALLKAQRHQNQLEVVQPKALSDGQRLSDEAPLRIAQPAELQPVAAEEDSGKDGVRGVIRNLEAGHFKGVADVRLRINFFDELSARNLEAAKPALEAASTEFQTSLTDSFDALLSSVDLDDEIRQTVEGLFAEFQAALAGEDGELLAAVSSGTTIDSPSLESEIRSLFDSLMAQLGEVLAPATPVPDPGIEPVQGELQAVDSIQPVASPAGRQSVDMAAATDSLDKTEPVAEISPVAIDGVSVLPVEDDRAQDSTAVSSEEALASLQDAFDDALSQLLDGIDSATQLAAPAPYEGNGGAYHKFLSILDAMRSTEPTVDEPA